MEKQSGERGRKDGRKDGEGMSAKEKERESPGEREREKERKKQRIASCALVKMCVSWTSSHAACLALLDQLLSRESIPGISPLRQDTR